MATDDDSEKLKRILQVSRTIAVVGLSTNAQDLSAFNASTQVHIIIDVTGYEP